MAENITYLITGANRGIGLAITAILLTRPNRTVIATVRTPTTSTTDLLSLPVHETSKVLITILDFSSPAVDTFTDLLARLSTNSIKQIDVVIANAGLGSSFHPSLTTPVSSILEHFETNTLGPILLYQCIYPFFKTPSETSASVTEKKFILISSSLGSIAAMEGAAPTLAYGASKAAANYFVRKIHYEEKGIIALAIHPGWVKTGNGQNFADSVGVEEPPMSVEESAKGVLEQIDAATKETASGTFASYDGTVIPW